MQAFEEELQVYNRQLDRGFASLRFHGPLEAEFRKFFTDHNVMRQRGAIIVAIILLLGMLPLDIQHLDGVGREFYLFSRIWVTVPLLVVTLFVTFVKSWRPYFPIISFATITIIGVSASVVLIFSAKQNQPIAYEILLLAIMVSFFLGGLYFHQSLVCSSIIGASYILLSEILLTRESVNYHHYFFLFATILIGGVSAYTLEYQTRIAFLNRGALHNLAKTDPLTGLYNRGAINDKLNHLIYYAFREKKPLTILLVDVDHFKNYNDFYGHIQGDRCLKQVASALSSCCKRPLDFAGRYGGEEFIIMWFDAQPSEVESLARRVKEAIDAIDVRHDASGTHSHVTVSGGMVTGIPDSQHQVDKILHQADQCLYRAKESGRNRIVIQDLGCEHDINAIVK